MAGYFIIIFFRVSVVLFGLKNKIYEKCVRFAPSSNLISRHFSRFGLFDFKITFFMIRFFSDFYILLNIFFLKIW